MCMLTSSGLVSLVYYYMGFVVLSRDRSEDYGISNGITNWAAMNSSREVHPNLIRQRAPNEAGIDMRCGIV